MADDGEEDAAIQKSQMSNNENFLCLFKKKDNHGSIILPFFTLGVIPGIMDRSVFAEATIYDERGNVREAKADLGRIERVWIGWLFFVWGSFLSESNESSVNIAIQNSIPKLLQQSNTNAVK